MPDASKPQRYYVVHGAPFPPSYWTVKKAAQGKAADIRRYWYARARDSLTTPAIVAIRIEECAELPPGVTARNYAALLRERAQTMLIQDRYRHLSGAKR